MYILFFKKKKMLIAFLKRNSLNSWRLVLHLSKVSIICEDFSDIRRGRKLQSLGTKMPPEVITLCTWSVIVSNLFQHYCRLQQSCFEGQLPVPQRRLWCPNPSKPMLNCFLLLTRLVTQVCFIDKTSHLHFKSWITGTAHISLKGD